MALFTSGSTALLQILHLFFEDLSLQMLQVIVLYWQFWAVRSRITVPSSTMRRSGKFTHQCSNRHLTR